MIRREFLTHSRAESRAMLEDLRRRLLNRLRTVQDPSHEHMKSELVARQVSSFKGIPELREN